jgi:hypothetical protein
VRRMPDHMGIELSGKTMLILGLWTRAFIIKIFSL